MGSGEPGGRARRALLIGIDRYRSPKIPSLDGCVNDVTLMRSTLVERFGFDDAMIRTLTNEEATRDAILEALDALVAATGRDDIVVFHYAGHGSQMTDREGDEASGLDNTFMPFDSEGWSGDNRDITDDEFNLRLQELGDKTSFTTLVVDACHSATITRDVFGGKGRSVPADLRPASELPPSPIPVAKRRALDEPGPSGWMPLTDKYVLIAGCRDEEISYEYRPPEGKGLVAHGATSYFLCSELRHATPGTTYRDVFERVAAKVNMANDRQHPQLEGRIDREVFGVRDITPMRFVRVVGREGEVVTLGAGAALGMTAGSRWTIHPQGTKSADDESTVLGEVEITTVRAVTSDARILSEREPEVIEPDARAVERVHAYGELRQRVQLVDTAGDPASVEALRALLTPSPLLQEVGEAEPAAVRIYLLAPRAMIDTATPVPQLGPLVQPTWATVSDAGQLTDPPKPVSAPAEVVRNLEVRARYRQALALDNPDPASPLRDQVKLELLRQDGAGAWVVAEPEEAGGSIVYEEGEGIAFRITNTYTKPLFINLLDFGVSGAVTPIFPARNATDKIESGVTFELGTTPTSRGKAAFPLALPNAFPYRAGEPGEGAQEGTETIKLFVTTGVADFSFLQQQGVRSAPAPARGRASSPLQRLWETAAMGNATRDIVLSEPFDEEEDWTTVVKPFTLRRRTGAPLASDGAPVVLGDVTLVTAGLTGAAKRHRAKSGRARASELVSGAFAEALEGEGVAVRQTVEITGARPAGMRGAGPAPTLDVSIRDPGPGVGQMLMATDELGVVTWHFAEATSPQETRRRGIDDPGAQRRYRVPGAVPDEAAAAAAAPGSRGLVGAVGRKFLKELVFPLVDPLIGEISESFALRWEGRNRPYRVRTFAPGSHSAPDAPAIDGDGWRRLGEGRALLFVHGTFSRAHSAFGALPEAVVGRLGAHYGGRVFALDHHTLSHDPKENVRWFLEHIPDGTSLDVDIVCHSRGGLVSRMLAERQGELAMGGRSVRVGSVVFVAAPNAGTALADGEHVGTLIDTFTNLLTFFPDNGVSDVLSGVVTVAKQLAVGASKGLPGLRAMQPGGDFATLLNAGERSGATRYHAIASDFAGGTPGLMHFARARLMERILPGANDLVVPTDGVFSANGSGWFPIEDREVLSGSDAVAHTGFFANAKVQSKLMEWLGA